MKPFEYHAPRTLTEAVELLLRYNGRAQALAGGTDLLIKLKTRAATPRAVVNIKRIPELRGLAFNAHLSLGALTTAEEMRCSPLLREHYPALSAAAASMASVQIRNLATVGGNLCSASPSADLAPILIALGGVVRLFGPDGERRAPLADFFLGPGQTVLGCGELLVAVEVPRPDGPALYRKYSPRAHMDIAVVGVALALHGYDPRAPQCRSAEVVLGAVAPTPLRALRAAAELRAGPLTPDRIERAARLAAEEARPIDDVRSSAWHRRRMVEVLTRRGLLELTGQSG
ncbi:MAG: xanthine dehydrogenase family protein subunit M [Chloroflexi bacterium]|nr:xanthine dehydrogenase family protein subunit M [Chloroflexota bacterium]